MIDLTTLSWKQCPKPGTCLQCINIFEQYAREAYA